MISITTPYVSAKILLSLDDFESNFNDPQSDVNLMATATFIFLGLWVVQLVAFCIYSLLGGEIFGPYKHRVILGRHTMDTLSMLAFSYMGWEALNNFGGFDSIPTLAMPNGSIANVGAERAYLFSAAAQRLCIVQVAYEIKNFCDSVIHNDGAIFLIHHTVTCLLSVSTRVLLLYVSLLLHIYSHPNMHFSFLLINKFFSLFFSLFYYNYIYFIVGFIVSSLPSHLLRLLSRLV